MKPSDFTIGMNFWMSGSRYRCTDIGTRIVTAICVDLDQLDKNGREIDPSWFNGPPYAVEELVIDECDLEACSPGRYDLYDD